MLDAIAAYCLTSTFAQYGNGTEQVETPHDGSMCEQRNAAVILTDLGSVVVRASPFDRS